MKREPILDKVIINGDRLKEIIFDSGENFLSIERKYGFLEGRFRPAANYRGYLSKKDVESFCSVFRVDSEELSPSEEDIERLLRRKNKGCQSLPKKKEKEQSFPETLPGLFYFCSVNSIDHFTLAEMTDFYPEEIEQVFACVKQDKEIIKAIASVLNLSSEDLADLAEKPISKRVPLKSEIDEIFSYGVELFSESANAEVLGCSYFWDRACLAMTRQELFQEAKSFRDQSTKARADLLEKRASKMKEYATNRGSTIEESQDSELEI